VRRSPLTPKPRIKAPFRPIAVICDEVVPGAVRADLVTAHPTADLLTPKVVRIPHAPILVSSREPRSEYLHREPPVLMLRALVVDTNLETRRTVRRDDTCLGLVPLLPTWPGPARRRDVHILLTHGYCTGSVRVEHCDGDGRRLDASAPLCRRDALPSMTACFIRE